MTQTFDEQLDDGSTAFLTRLRSERVLSDAEWARIETWLNEAMRTTGDGGIVTSRVPGGTFGIDVDADPRNALWLDIVAIRRLTGYALPEWAALWLARLHDRGDREFWSRVACVASAEGLPTLPET